MGIAAKFNRVYFIEKLALYKKYFTYADIATIGNFDRSLFYRIKDINRYQECAFIKVYRSLKKIELNPMSYIGNPEDLRSFVKEINDFNKENKDNVFEDWHNDNILQKV